MSKSILVIDTPISCHGCKLDISCYVYKNLIVDRGTHLFMHTVHPKCPLQDTTELLEALESLFDTVETIPTVTKMLKDDLCVEEEETAYNKLHKALGGLDE